MTRNTIGILILIFTWVKYSQANDFPSLLVANATMGIFVIFKTLYQAKTRVLSTIFTQNRCDN